MAGLLGNLSDQDILNLIELQRQLMQSPFNQQQGQGLPPGTNDLVYRTYPGQPPIQMPKPEPWHGLPPGVDPKSLLQPLSFQAQVPGITVMPENPQGTPPVWPPYQSPRPQETPPPLPDRNPKRQALEQILRDAAADSAILEQSVIQGQTSPNYTWEEFNTEPRKRKHRKAV